MMIDGPAGGDVTIYEFNPVGTKGTLRDLPSLVAQALRLLAAADRRGLLLLVGSTLASGALVGVEAFAARIAVGSAIGAYGDRSGVSAVLAPVLVFLAATVVGGALRAWSEGRQELLAERARVHAQGVIVDTATAAPLTAFDTPEFANRLYRASNGLHQPIALVRSLLMSTQALVYLAVSVLALLVIAPPLALAVPLAVVPIVLAFLRRGQDYYAFAFGMTPLERERGYLAGVLMDREAAKEMRAFGVAPFLRRRYEELTAQRMVGLRGVLRSQLRAQLIASVATGLLTGVLLIGLLELALSGRFAIADLTVGAGLIVLVGSQVGSFGWAFSALWESALFLRNLTELMDAPVEATSSSASPSASASSSAAAGSNTPTVGALESLAVQGVSFAYPASAEPVLHDVDLTIGVGEVVALVGENGSGKTTLAKLIGGFFPPASGRITWNGVSVDDLDRDALREQVTVLFQDFVHYQLSAHLNVGLGHPSTVDDEEAVQTAARTAGAHDVVTRLPDGYATLLGPTFIGGTDLSGGQWQRVALARALVRTASLVVLDEPTAALDPRAEHELFARIRSLFAGRAVLLVSHRFSTVREADRIHVLHEGRVVESGDHASLMALGGRYAELYALQAAAFQE